MREIEVEGASKEEAIREALKILGVERDRVEVEVIDEGSRGFLGIFGGRMAKVRVRVKDAVEDVIRDVVGEIIEAMEIDVRFDVKRSEIYWCVDFEGPDVRYLIGRRGETINALQFLASMIVSRRTGERLHLVMDAEGYRKRREETLRRLARRLSERVRRTKRDVVLEPMSPQDRRIIHLELKEDPWVYTVSRGEEPYRRVLISLRR
ncbi:MAG: RNA-binding cell elongation regulator Jag/EloR [Thermacetogeniaceae bacterium]